MTMKWVQALSSLFPLKENIVLFFIALITAMTVTLAFTHGEFWPIEQWELQVQPAPLSMVGANGIESNVSGRWENVDHLITQTHSILKSFPYLSMDRIRINTSFSQGIKVVANAYTKVEEGLPANPKLGALFESQQEDNLYSSGIFLGARIIKVPQAVIVAAIFWGILFAAWFLVWWRSGSAVMIRNFGWLQNIRRDLVKLVHPQPPEHSVGRAMPFVSPHYRMVTVLFMDIRGFSQIAETLAPEEVNELLGEFYTEMTEAVSHHGGMIDKYMGDAVMALFNVPYSQPDHADRAVSAALNCQHRLHSLSAYFQQRYGHPLVCGFGIHTGEALVGSLGFGHRMDYTVVGDTVNLGANLEGLSKVYDVPIVMSESTHQALTSVCHSRYLDEIRVKGRERFDRIYTVTEQEDRKVSRVPIQGHVVLHQEGLRFLGKICDVSTSGLALEQLDHPMNEGSLLNLDLHPVGGDFPPSLKAKVVWVRSHRAGFQFLQTTQDFHPDVEKFLSRSAQ